MPGKCWTIVNSDSIPRNIYIYTPRCPSTFLGWPISNVFVAYLVFGRLTEKWKGNTILGALHRAKRIATNWKAEVKAIKQSFIKAGYPTKLVNDLKLSVILKTQKATKQ